MRVGHDFFGFDGGERGLGGFSLDFLIIDPFSNVQPK